MLIKIEMAIGLGPRQERVFDLEERLVNYTVAMSELVEMLPVSRSGNYLVGQLIRSCHSPTFNYGEAQAAESRQDFIHKLGVCLKELKECRIALKIIRKRNLVTKQAVVNGAYNETEELVAIIASSIETAKRNREKDKRV